MIPLIVFIALAAVIVVLIEIRERKRNGKASKETVRSEGVAFTVDADRSDADSQETAASRPEGCCGEHLVCERETLLQTNAKIEYYDDEELDGLTGIAADEYTDEQANAIREVFATLRESDVPGWCRSMQLRNIALPEDVREEALLIVKELRS